MKPALVVLSGLPGVGKTTIARALARETGAVHLRIDTIEAALGQRGVCFSGARGDIAYVVAYELARDGLRLGQSAIVDAVHGWPGAETLWSGALAGTSARLVRVDVTCSELAVHRRRVEARRSNEPGAGLPSWSAVVARAFVPIANPDLTLDTAALPPATAAATIRAEMREDRPV